MCMYIYILCRKDTHLFGVYGWPGPKYHSDVFVDLADDLKVPEWFKPSSKDMNQVIIPSYTFSFYFDSPGAYITSFYLNKIDFISEGAKA